MNTIALLRNVAALGDLLRLSDHATAIAGGSGDATSVTGNSIDRQGFGGSLPESALMGVQYEATLGSGKTLSYTLTVQDSADNSTFADFLTQAATVFATGPSGGGVVKGSANIAVNLTSARRYFRFNFKPTHSATGTDTSYSDAAGFIAGFDRLPAPNTQ